MFRLRIGRRSMFAVFVWTVSHKTEWDELGRESVAISNGGARRVL